MKIRRFQLDYILVAVLFVLSIGLRLVNVSGVATYPDELTYWNRGILTISANWAWRDDFMSDQPPLFIYLVAIVVAAFDSSIEAIRNISVVSGSLSAIVLYFWGKSMFNRAAGFVAGLVLAINGFSILYSKLAYIESLVILLIISAGYLFWEGVVKQRKTTTALVGGIMLGLALDAKYMALIAYPAIIAFVIFRRRKNEIGFRSKPFLTYISASALVFAPILITLIVNGKNPLLFQLFRRFLKSRAFQGYLPLDSILVQGFNNWVELLTHVSSTDPFGAFSIFPAYFVLSGVLFIVVSVYHLTAFLKGRQRETLLLAFFAVYVVFAVSFPVRRQYYLLYALPFYALMVGSFVSAARTKIKHIETKHLAPKVLPTLSVVFVVAILSLNMLALPAFDANGIGALDEIIPAMDYIDKHLVPGAYIGTLVPATFYYVGIRNLNATVVPLFALVDHPVDVNERIQQTPVKKVGAYKTYVFTTDVIGEFDPQFLIITRPQYDQVFKTAMKQTVEKNYRLAMAGNVVLLFERITP